MRLMTHGERFSNKTRKTNSHNEVNSRNKGDHISVSLKLSYYFSCLLQLRAIYMHLIRSKYTRLLLRENNYFVGRK